MWLPVVDGVRIIDLDENPHLDVDVAACLRTGFLWMWAVPRDMPYLHLIMAKQFISEEEAMTYYNAWSLRQIKTAEMADMMQHGS